MHLQRVIESIDNRGDGDGEALLFLRFCGLSTQVNLASCFILTLLQKVLLQVGNGPLALCRNLSVATKSLLIKFRR